MSKKVKQNENKNTDTVLVFFSEKAQVFYLKDKNLHTPTNNFIPLITCKRNLFNDFLKSLAEFHEANNPKVYLFNEIEDKLNHFIINKATDGVTNKKVA
ncbi:hypothetical protein PL373_09350 [Tenacibaculum maritimum]|nr:hypothetical protein [Tenacibaculum maritimum]MDB0601350.1 hypothetical protein [Tenacibaculum maritimum]MDB0611771.1 hypothetical protein [Tenacibaculum maritimum]